MKHNIVSEELSYYLRLAQGHTVTHTEPMRFSHAGGRMFYGFVHLLKGQIQYEFPQDGSTMHIHTGQIVYIPKHCRYICIYPAEETVVAVLNFDLSPESTLQLPQTVTILSGDTQRIFKGFHNQRVPMNSLQCAARVYELLDILLRTPPAIAKKYRRLQPAIAYIEKHPTVDVNVDFYANLCGMSTSGFRRSFRDYVGISPIEYRNDLRLRYAKMLLISGEYSAEEAARQSGFNNISFFYRLFRRKFGTSPGKF